MGGPQQGQGGGGVGVNVAVQAGGMTPGGMTGGMTPGGVPGGGLTPQQVNVGGHVLQLVTGPHAQRMAQLAGASPQQMSMYAAYMRQGGGMWAVVGVVSFFGGAFFWELRFF